MRARPCPGAKRLVAVKASDPRTWTARRWERNRLSGIIDAQGISLSGDGPDLGDGHDRPGYVRRMDEHHGSRVPSDERDDIRRVELPSRGARHRAHLDPPGFEGPDRAHNRVVLHARGDHVVPIPEETEYGYVERLGRILREDDSEHILDAEERGQDLPRIEENPCRLDGEAVAGPAGAGADTAVEMDHGLHHAFRLGP